MTIHDDPQIGCRYPIGEFKMKHDHPIQDHSPFPRGECLHCDLAEVLMGYDTRGVPMEDILMEFATVMAVYICARDDGFRERMVAKFETGFRFMVFGSDAHQIRTLILHEPDEMH